MPILTPSDVHVDQPLTNLTIAYVQDQSRFKAGQVFPTLGVQKQSDLYYIYDRDNMNRVGDVKELAPRTEANDIELQVSNSTYYARVYGLRMPFGDQVLANEDAALEVRSAGAQTLVNRMLQHREDQFINTFFVDNVWGTNWDGVANADNDTGIEVTNWDDYTNSTPIVDVRRLMRTVELKSGGFKPNTMVVNRAVRDTLLDHPDILARLNGGSTITNTALVSDSKLAEIFDVETFVVLEAVKNTAAEGLAEVNSFVGSDACMLVHTPSSAGMMIPAAGMTFAWNEIPGTSGLGITVESFAGDYLREKQIAERIQVKMAYDMKITGADLGGFINSVLA